MIHPFFALSFPGLPEIVVMLTIAVLLRLVTIVPFWLILKKMKSHIFVIGALLLVGCDRIPSVPSYNQQMQQSKEQLDKNAQLQKAYEEQVNHAAQIYGKQTEHATRALEKQDQQIERLDRILEKWESQQKRYDALLTEWEKQKPSQ